MSIIQRHSYMITAPCGFIRNTHGGVSIVPKPSAGFIFSPPTKYTSHWVSETEYITDVKRDLCGSLLMTDQEGYDCLFISNALNGYYMQIGLWERDPYINHNIQGYIPPKYRKPGRPWARTLRIPQLTPIEICSTGQPIPNTYPGFKVFEDEYPQEVLDLHTGARLPNFPITRFVMPDLKNADVEKYISLEPTLKTEKTATYATNIAMLFISNELVKPIVLTQDCPPPYNAIQYEELSEIKQQVLQGYMHKTSVYLLLQKIDLANSVPYLKTQSNTADAVVLDTDLKYCEGEQHDLLNHTLPVLWDWPFVILHPNSAAVGVPNNKMDVQPVVVVPIMLYHEEWTDEKGRKHGVIDGRTGRRSARGKTIITYATDASIFRYYSQTVSVTPIMHQMSRPITNHPYFDPQSLKDIFDPKKRRKQ